MTIFFVVFILLHYAFEENVTALPLALVALYLCMMSLSGAMSADGKYKMTKIVDELLQQRGSGSEKKC